MRYDSTVRSRAKSSGSRSGSSSESSATTADESERDAHASAMSPSRTSGSVDELVGELGCASTARSSEHARGAGVGRALDRGREGGRLVQRGPARPCTAVSRILTRCPASVSLPRSSTSSSAISTATWSACSTPTSGPTPPVAISSRSRSSRSPGTRRKICCSGRRSWRAAPRRSRSSPPTPAAPRRWSAFPRRLATSPTRRRSARTVACRASTASTCSRTTRCSTSSATSRRPPSTAHCSSSPACGSRSRSAKTRGARPARSSRRRRVAPSSS